MTPQELDLLAAVLPFCERATLAFCLDASAARKAESSWLSIWSAVGKTYQQCRQRLRICRIATSASKPLNSESGKIVSRTVRRCITWNQNWSQPDQHHAVTNHRITHPPSALLACANPEAEAVLRRARNFAIRPRRRPLPRLRRAGAQSRRLSPSRWRACFAVTTFPFFLDRRESVAHHPLAELTRSALRTVAFDWAHDDWFAALKAGFSPVDEAGDRPAGKRGARPRLARREMARAASNRRRSGPGSRSSGCAKTSCRRLKISPRSSRNQKTSPPADNWPKPCANFGTNLDVEKTLERWSLADPEHSAIRTPQSALHQTVWDQMNAWLDNVALAFPDEPLPLRDWLPILEAGLANLTVGVIPPALDQVLIGAIDRARNPDLKLALVLGVNESVFPAAPAAPAILTDADRDELGRARRARPRPARPAGARALPTATSPARAPAKSSS